MTGISENPSTQPEPDTQGTLEARFSRFAPFQVPAYQRAYAWEKEHIEQFVEDLEEHPADNDYYLGHFLLERSEDGGIYVIDGQQRLTTLTLAFGVMARLLAASESQEHRALSKEITGRFLGAELEMRFQTVTKDQSLLQTLVFKGPAQATHHTRSQERLIKACNGLQTAFLQRSPDKLAAWAQTLSKARVTWLVVGNKVQATQIFIFQNSRGKKLTEFEKLKAFLMQQIYLHGSKNTANTAIGLVEQAFADMYERMEQIHLLNENDVLRHHDHAYSSHWGNPVDNLKQELSKIPESGDKLKRIHRFSQDLADTFLHVRLIQELMKTEEWLADPVILNGGTSWPLIIKLYKLFANSINQWKEVPGLLRKVEITLFKMHFQHGSVSNDLIPLAKELKDEAGLTELRRKLEGAAQSGFRNNRANFNSRARDYLNGDYHYHSISRYILWKYENDLVAPYDRKVSAWDYLNVFGKGNMQSTVEHISARNPRAGGQSPDFTVKYLNNLGNLVFMPKGMNSSLGNQSEADKQPVLNHSSFAAHREIAQLMGAAGEWTPDSILARKAKIIEFARKRWEIPVSEPGSGSASASESA